MYNLLFTDRFSHREDMYAVTAGEFTAEETTNILIKRFITLWGRLFTLLQQWSPVQRSTSDTRIDAHGYTQTYDKRLSY